MKRLHATEPASRRAGARAPAAARLRVAFVGGVLHRSESELVSFGAGLGVDVEVHEGQTRGHRSDRLASLVKRTDIVVIVTGTNSHNGVLLAKREATKRGATLRRLQACGLETARKLIAEVATRSAA